MLRCVSAWTLRILEHESTVVLAFPHQRKRQLMILFRLRVIAAEDVSRQSTIGDDATNGSHTFQIPLARIFSVHQLQDAVASALYRQMDVSADIRIVGNHLQRLVAHILRMRSCESDAHIRHRLSHSSEQLREVNLRSLSLGGLIRVHILSQQRHLFETLCLQVLHFVQDAADVPASLTSSGVRHDAIMAEVVAATHDAHKPGNAITTDTFGYDVLISFCCRQLNIDGFLASFDSSK